MASSGKLMFMMRSPSDWSVRSNLNQLASFVEVTCPSMVSGMCSGIALSGLLFGELGTNLMFRVKGYV